MSKSLELIFRNEEGKRKTITIAEPREDVTKSEANAVMQRIVEKDVFESTGGSLTEPVEARYRNHQTEVIED